VASFGPPFSTLEIPEGKRNRGDLRQPFYSVNYYLNLAAVSVNPELKNKLMAFPLAQTVIHRATRAISMVAKPLS
jgi:hypothetical protein